MKRKFCIGQHIFSKAPYQYSCTINMFKPLNLLRSQEKDKLEIIPCPYNESDIKLMDEYGNGEPQIRIQKNPKPEADGVCRDFKILQEIEQELLPKLTEEFKSQ